MDRHRRDSSSSIQAEDAEDVPARGSAQATKSRNHCLFFAIPVEVSVGDLNPADERKSASAIGKCGGEFAGLMVCRQHVHPIHFSNGLGRFGSPGHPTLNPQSERRRKGSAGLLDQTEHSCGTLVEQGIRIDLHFAFSQLLHAIGKLRITQFELNCAIGRLLQEPIAAGRIDFFAKSQEAPSDFDQAGALLGLDSKRQAPGAGIAVTNVQCTFCRCLFGVPGSDAGDIERIGASSHVDLKAPSVSRRRGLEQKARTEFKARRLTGYKLDLPEGRRIELGGPTRWPGLRQPRNHRTSRLRAPDRQSTHTSSWKEPTALSWAFVHGRYRCQYVRLRPTNHGSPAINCGEIRRLQQGWQMHYPWCT